MGHKKTVIQINKEQFKTGNYCYSLLYDMIIIVTTLPLKIAIGKLSSQLGKPLTWKTFFT